MQEDIDRWYESFPDFTAHYTPDMHAERLAHAIRFTSDPKLGKPAVLLMDMIAYGITSATKESSYCCEGQGHNPNYFQAIRGENDEYYIELSAPECLGKARDLEQEARVTALGWILPNEDSPNYHREFDSTASPRDIAAIAAEGWYSAFPLTFL